MRYHRLLVLMALLPGWRLVLHAGEATKGNGDAGVSALISALTDDDAEIRRNAALNLGYSCPALPAVVKALVRTLEDKDLSVRAAALTALGRLGPEAPEAMPKLLAELPDSGELQWKYYGTILRIAPGAVTELTGALKNRNESIRRTAINALGEAGSAARSAVSNLTEILRQGKSRETRLLACEALGRILRPARDGGWEHGCYTSSPRGGDVWTTRLGVVTAPNLTVLFSNLGVPPGRHEIEGPNSVTLLNVLASDGWELLSVVSDGAGDGVTTRYHFRRKVTRDGDVLASSR